MILLFILAGIFYSGHVANLNARKVPAFITIPDTKARPDSIPNSSVLQAINNCSKCRYVIPENKNIIDGKALGIQPGDTICLHATNVYRAPLKFMNITGTKEKYVVITNCGGAASVNIEGNYSYIVKFENSQYLRITGEGCDGKNGIALNGQATLGISFDAFTSDFEADHLEIGNVKFAGIMAKTDPNCDDATIRGNFTLRNAFIHHNYIHDTGGEGIYVGNSFYSKGVTLPCGVRFPHDLVNVKIYNNYIKNSAWEAIQLGSAIKDAEIYGNIIENYGQANVNSQNNGIQIGEGTGGLCYNNYIHSGKGNGIIVLGLGDNVVFNNIIADAGNFGIFCDDRLTTGTGFNFINNTIINSHSDGIRIYADNVKQNSVINNLIVNPGSFDEYERDATKRTGKDSYLYLLNSKVIVKMSHNIFTREAGLIEFDSPLDLGRSLTLAGTQLPVNLKVKRKLPVIDGGQDVSSFGIKFDFDNNPRPRGRGYDVGAIEYPIQ